ncbi:PREDICTED: NACHT domain- and WD repeat-containing protein 1 [Calidris pugnax]|uniref:NACHT domain- and WD repeat-containing protein 1 n=1 Tax=Calidris pugnax TaxID=198806 RepID=UPI00071E2FF7|nr:PREDICTED: NACHT domain- and WD repeat-containing protein 1 [Calidris pugnax]
MRWSFTASQCRQSTNCLPKWLKFSQVFLKRRNQPAFWREVPLTGVVAVSHPLSNEGESPGSPENSMSFSPDTRRDLLCGKMVPLPFQPSSLVQIFISSVFADMAKERETLLEKAYPEVQAFCQKHGLMLEVIDLRWGVSELVDSDPRNTQLSLEEIEACQKLSAGPTFIVSASAVVWTRSLWQGVTLQGDTCSTLCPTQPSPITPSDHGLLGDRCGHQPVPRLIAEKEFEALILQLPGDSAQLLAQWYWRDENALPTCYVLQPAERQAWCHLEGRVASALRVAALKAERCGLMGPEQRHRYHKPAIEWEIEQGLLNTQQSNPGAFIFLREFEESNRQTGQGTTSELLEKEDNLDSEGKQLLNNLKAKIASCYPQHLQVHTLPCRTDSGNPQRKEKNKYLKQLCEQFIAVINHQILENLPYRGQSSEEPGRLLEELGHHAALCLKNCRFFCGRQNLLDNIFHCIRQNNDKTHTTLILYGPPGCGKTAVMCKLSEQVQAVLGEDSVVVIRLLGTSQLSSAIHSLLRDICLQVCLAFDLPPPPTQTKQACSDLVLFLSKLLLTVSRRGAHTLVVFLDSVERLHPGDGAHRFHWLPPDCPPRVHIIISISTAEPDTLKALQHAVPEAEAYFEVGPLTSEEGEEMLETLLASDRRRLSPAQWAYFHQSFPNGGQALLFQLAFHEARKWASYTSPSELVVASTAQEAMHHLWERLEKSHGTVLVAHVLGYIASSRNGLSEMELKDILSLDDEALSEIHHCHLPSSKTILRLPPLRWARLRREMGACLAERKADGFTLLCFAHRQFVETVQNRYLSKQDQIKRHFLLADFFKGTWSWGMKKPLTLPHLSRTLSADRKVAPQPLWFSDTVANLRKLSELPFHLLNAGRIEELKRDVLGNMNWISCKIIACGIESVVDDFAMCTRRIRCPELRLVQETLLLSKPAVSGVCSPEGMSLIYTEMLARLLFLVPSYPEVIGELCQQCLSWCRACPYPLLIPRCGFLQPPGGPLRTTLTGFLKGVTAMALCSDQRLLVAGSQDGSMLVWNMEVFEMLHALPGHSAEVRCVKVFGKGSRAVSAAMDHSLRVWNLISGRTRFIIQDTRIEEQPSDHLHVDEGHMIVYSSSDTKVNAWHLETAELIFQISGEASDTWMCSAVFSPRLVIVTVSAGGTLSLWDSNTGQLRSKRQLPGLQEETPTSSVLIQKQGKMIVGFSGGSLSVISCDGNSLLEKLPGRVCFVVASEDESILAAGFEEYVRVYRADPAGFQRFLTADLEHDARVQTAVISAGNSIVVTASQAASIQVWSLAEQGLLTDTLDGTGEPVTLLALHDCTLVSASHSTPSLRVWNLIYNHQQKNPVPAPNTGCAALSHGGNYVYFTQTEDTQKVIIWNTTEGDVCDTLDTSARVRCLEIAEQNQLLFTGLISGTVLVFPLNSRQDVACIPPPESQKPVKDIAIDKQEKQLAIAYDDLVLVLDIIPADPCPVINRPTYTFKTQLPDALISRVAILTDHRLLYGMTSGELFLYDCPRARVFPLEGHRNQISCLESSHREQQALSGSEDSLQCLWDLEFCQQEHEMCYYKPTSLLRGICCACFSKDDKYLYSASLDQAITVWDVTSGALLAVQCVYTTAHRIVPTADGFVAVTKAGCIIREQFHCPKTTPPQYNPLQNTVATCTVKSRKKDRENSSKQQYSQGNPSGSLAHTSRVSQICSVA